MKKDQEIDTSFDISHLLKRTPKNGGRTERAWHLTWKTAEPCLGMSMVTQNVQNAAVGRLSSRFETHLKSNFASKVTTRKKI